MSEEQKQEVPCGREISRVTSAEEQGMQAEAKAISEALLELYGEYMPSQTRRKALEIPEKFVVRFEQEDRKLKEGHTAAYLGKDGLMVINGDYIRDLAGVLSSMGVGVTRLELFSTLLAMEAAHRLQDDSLARTFLECGASYYAREVLRHLGKRWVSEGFLAERADLYGELIANVERFRSDLGHGGEAVHHLFFGTSQGEEGKHLAYGFLADHRRELSKLFPEWGRK